MLEMQRFTSEIDDSPLVSHFVNYLYYGAQALKSVNSLTECLQLCSYDEYYLLGGLLKQVAELRLKENIDPSSGGPTTLL